MDAITKARLALGLTAHGCYDCKHYVPHRFKTCPNVNKDLRGPDFRECKGNTLPNWEPKDELVR